MSAILKTPMIQQMLSVMTTTQVSSLLAMMDTDQVAVNYNVGMATNGIPTTLATNPTFATISMERFYVMKTSADTPATAELHKETKKVTGALYQPVAGTPNYSFIEFGQDICRFWAFVSGQAMIVPETLSTVELRAEVLKRELENFSTAISCDAQGNVGIDGNLQVNGSETSTENISADGFIQTDNYVRPLTEADRLNYSFTQAETAISEEVTAGAGTYSIVYGLARTSNGKLNIVVFGKVTITDDLTISRRSRFTSVDIPISANVGSHIFPISGVLYDAVDYKQADLFRVTGFPPTADDFIVKIYFGLKKDSSVSLKIGLALGSGTIPVGSYAFRIEENITL